MPWSALLVPPHAGPAVAARVAATPVLHAWSSWGSAPAVLFAVEDLRPVDVLALCELLADLDLAWLAEHPDAPRLHEAAPRPSADGPPPETWLTIPWILAGARPRDCKALSAWRVAEIRLRGEAARIDVGSRIGPRGVLEYHVRVRRASGEVEDPQAEMRALRARVLS